MDENLIVENNILRGYKEKGIITINIPEGVAAIGDNAFSDFHNLQTITLPKSLVKIGNNAFQNCPKLTEIDLTYVTTIGEKAFLGCSDLTSVTFGEKIGYLANAIFLGCSSLTEIILPENIAYIGCECFKDCTALSSIEMLGVMEIDNNAFEHCINLFNLSLPKSLTHISPNAFSFCGSLSSVIVQNRYVDIDETAFEYDVNFIIKAVQYSTSQLYTQQRNYKYQPIVLEDEYRIVTSEQLAVLSKAGILLHAKKVTTGTDEILIHFDRSALSKIIALIGGNDNDQ